MSTTASDIQAILGVLRRQWKLIVVMGLLLTGVAGAVTFAMRPIYTASTLILVDPSRKNLLEPQGNAATSNSDNARIESEVELAASDSVLMRVIADLNLTSNSEFSPQLGMREQLLIFLRIGATALPTGEQALNEVLGALADTVSVQRRGFTFLLAVQTRSSNPARAAEIANSVAQNYIREQLDSKIQAVETAQDALNARLAAAQQNIVVADDAFDDYVTQNIRRIEAESGNSTIASLRQQIEALQQTRDSAQVTANAVAQQLADRDFTATTASLASDALRELERQRAALAAQLDVAATDSAAAVDLRGQLAQIEGRLSDAAESELDNLRQTITTNDQLSDSLREQIRTAVLDTDLSSQVLTEIYGLQQRAQVARSQYETLLARSEDLEAQASLQLADSRIISPALPPATPSAPNIRTNLLLGALAGLAIGLGLAFLYENYIGGFTSEQQAENLLHLPIAAAIPKLRRNLPDGASPADLTESAPLSSYAESIRRIIIGVDQALDLSESPRAFVVMVTSALPDEGKSTTALALARSYALSGKLTLLIDGDLRKPNLHRLLGLKPKYGLLDFLSSKSSTIGEEVVHRDTRSELLLLLGARRSAVSTHKIVSDDGFKHLLQTARNSFDVVVVDTSPLAPVVDGLQIARLADAVVFIVRWGRTNQQDAKKALMGLQAAARHKPTMLVLNQQEVSASEYARRYSNYYSDEPVQDA